MTHSSAEPKTGDSPLYKAINSLRSDVQRLVDSSWSKEVRFEVPEIKLELELVAQETKGANGELAVTWLPVTVKVGGKKEHAETRTHRLSLTLKPIEVDEQGNPKRVYLKSKKKRKLPKQGNEAK